MSDTIIIGFSRPPANQFPPPVFAWAIMAFESIVARKKVNFSHSYVRFHSDSYSRDLLYQASGLRVNFIGFPMFLSQEIVVHEFVIPVSAETKQAVIQFAIDNVGAPYALLNAFGIVAVKFMALFGKKIKNPVNQKGHFCSELTALTVKDFLDATKSKLSVDDVKRMMPIDDYNFLAANFGGGS